MNIDTGHLVSQAININGWRENEKGRERVSVELEMKKRAILNSFSYLYLVLHKHQ